jgi:hypothetical protein
VKDDSFTPRKTESELCQSDLILARKYRVGFSAQAQKLGLLGFDAERLAVFFEVPKSAIELWADLYPEFDQSLSLGSILADAAVAQSTYDAAVGFTHPSVKIFAHKLKVGEGIEEIVVTEHKYTEHYSPNVQAAMFWLTNRQPDLWKNRTDQNLQANITADGGALGALKKMNAEKSS